MLIMRREYKGILVFDTDSRQYYLVESPYDQMLLKVEESGDLAEENVRLLESSNLICETESGIAINGRAIFNNVIHEGRLSAPLIVFLQITDRCNLRCKHCFTGDSRAVVREELSFDEICKLLERLSELGVFEVVIGGGEPFVRRDILQILQCANSLHITPSVTTNGTLLTDEMFSELKKCQLGYLKISLDGDAEEHDYIRGKGSFARAQCTLSRLLENNIPTGVRMVVNAHNYKSIHSLYKVLLDMGCPSLSFSMIRPSGNTLSNKELYDGLSPKVFREITDSILALKSENKMRISLSEDAPYVKGLNENAAVLPELLPCYGCSVKGTVCEIDAAGDMSPCGFLKNLIGEKLIGGNIRTRDFLDIWDHSESFNQFRHLDVPNACQKCEHVFECHGGCRTRAYYATGKFSEVDPLCYDAF